MYALFSSEHRNAESPSAQQVVKHRRRLHRREAAIHKWLFFFGLFRFLFFLVFSTPLLASNVTSSTSKIPFVIVKMKTEIRRKTN